MSTKSKSDSVSLQGYLIFCITKMLRRITRLFGIVGIGSLEKHMCD